MIVFNWVRKKQQPSDTSINERIELKAYHCSRARRRSPLMTPGRVGAAAVGVGRGRRVAGHAAGRWNAVVRTAGSTWMRIPAALLHVSLWRRVRRLRLAATTLGCLPALVRAVG